MANILSPRATLSYNSNRDEDDTTQRINLFSVKKLWYMEGGGLGLVLGLEVFLKFGTGTGTWRFLKSGTGTGTGT